ncbi:MAG TPA: LLM class flavin-dependent oxidoreductase [Candidatus Tectomicrobia bacterium]
MSVLNLGRYPPARLLRLAQLQEECGYETFWYADERFFREVYAGLTCVALHTRTLQVGTMVTDPYTRHPALTAMAIATLDEIAGGRAILGLGAGVAGFREMHIARHKPAQAMRETVAVVRALLRGETVDVRGEVIALTHGQLDFQPVRPQVPVYIASNGPLGLALAGEIAQGAVMQSAVAPALVDWFIAQVRRGAQRAGRALSEVDLVARLNLCIHEDPRVAKDVMRPTVVRTLITQQPHFRTFVTAGLALPARLQETITALGYTHDAALLAPAAALVPDDFVDALTLAGTVEDVAAQVVRLVRQGVTHVMVYPIAPDGDVERLLRSFAQEVMPLVHERL